MVPSWGLRGVGGYQRGGTGRSGGVENPKGLNPKPHISGVQQLLQRAVLVVTDEEGSGGPGFARGGGGGRGVAREQCNNDIVPSLRRACIQPGPTSDGNNAKYGVSKLLNLNSPEINRLAHNDTVQAYGVLKYINKQCPILLVRSKYDIFFFIVIIWGTH